MGSGEEDERGWTRGGTLDPRSLTKLSGFRRMADGGRDAEERGAVAVSITGSILLSSPSISTLDASPGCVPAGANYRYPSPNRKV